MKTPIVVADGTEPVTLKVARKTKEVDEFINNFESNAEAGNPVIGLDIEWSLNEKRETGSGGAKSKIAILTLCNRSHCLIVQLLHLDSVSKSLMNFLYLPDYTFVGFDTAKNMEKLEKEYGFGCKNYTDLRTMAAKGAEGGKFQSNAVFWGLARMVKQLHPARAVDKPKSVVFDDWGNKVLSDDQIKKAMLNAFACYELGVYFLPS